MKLKKKINLFLICVIVNAVCLMVFPAQVVELPELRKPDSIRLDDKHVYIADGAAIHIYSAKNFRHKRTFGRRGEGPKEFKTESGLRLNVDTDFILVESMDKLSYFSKKGDFIKEHRSISGARKFIPLGNHLVAICPVLENNIRCSAAVLLDRDFNRIKEIYRRKPAKRTKKRPFLTATWEYEVYDNKLYSATSNDFIIHVFNDKGDKVHTISQNYEKVRVTEAAIDEFFQFLKKYRPPEYYDIFKRILVFPDYFPVVNDFRVTDGKIYVVTYKRDKENNKSEFLVLDLNGKILKKCFLPFHKRSPVHPSPFTVMNNKLYQLVDNENTETWELHIMGILN